MASVNDWAAKAALRILEEVRLPSLGNRTSYKPTEERVAAIIATFALPITELLRESAKLHSKNCEAWECDCDDEDMNTDDHCTCGASKWNKRIDEVQR